MRTPTARADVAVVHNGIIENFPRTARGARQPRASAFPPIPTPKPSRCCANTCSTPASPPREAARETLRRLEGAFALAFLFEGEEDLIVAARKGSSACHWPWRGRDVRRLRRHRAGADDRPITYLEEGDYAYHHPRGRADLRRGGPPRVNREMRKISRPGRPDRQGWLHKHFMAKEVFEQPVVLAECLAHYSSGDAVRSPKARLIFPRPTG